MKSISAITTSIALLIFFFVTCVLSSIEEDEYGVKYASNCEGT